MGRSVLLGKRTLIQKPLYQFPLLGLLALGVSSVSLGLGFKALKVFMDLAGVKSPTGSNRKLIDRPAVQSEVAKSIADLESSEAYMHACIDEAWEVAISGEKLSLDIKSKLRLAAVNATHRSVAAVDRLYQLGGGTSIYESNELQRCFRDIHVPHNTLWWRLLFMKLSQSQLGLDPRQPI